MKRIAQKSMTAKLLLAAACGLLGLAACEGMARIIPANPQAESLGGEMPVHMTSFSAGNGTLEAIGSGGEVLKGSYGPMQGNYNFGGIFNAVYGDYSTLPTAADKGTPTVTTLTGNKGTTLQCEFYNNDYNGHGFGGCKSLTGALYRIQY